MIQGMKRIFFAAGALIAFVPGFWTRFFIPVALPLGFGIPFNKKFPDYYLKTKGIGAIGMPVEPEEIPLMSRAGDFEGTFQFNLDGDQQATYHLEIKDRQCRLREGDSPEADVVIHTPLDVWRSIGLGKISGQEALMQGKYRVEGDLGLLTKMGEIFVFLDLGQN